MEVPRQMAECPMERTPSANWGSRGAGDNKPGKSTEKVGMFDNSDVTYARKRYPWGPLRGDLSRRFARLSCSACTDGASGKAVLPGSSDRPLYLLSSDCRVFRRLLLPAAFGPTWPALHGCCVGINRWTRGEGGRSEQRRDTYIVR